MPRPLPEPGALPGGVRLAPVPGQPISVRGGSGGIEAYAEELTALAARLGDCGLEVTGGAAGLQSIGFAPGELLSAVLDPAGAVRVESALMAALDGPHGMFALAMECGLLDAGLRSAAVLYTTADTLGTPASTVLSAIEHVPSVYAAWRQINADVIRGDWSAAGNDVQKLITADPAAAGLVIHFFQPTLAALAALIPAPRATVRAEGDDATDAAAAPPRSVSDLLGDLAQRDDQGAGGIDVRILGYPEGGRRVIVDITGMKTLNPFDFGNVTSPGYANQALYGQRTAYENGVLQAMREAGVRASDDVLLIGHSEGGLVAVNAARDAVNSGQYKVTHVITAGSPVSMTAGCVPRSVQVLAIENAGDPVPQLDGGPNPDQPNLTTVTVNHDGGTVGADHGLQTGYLPGASDIDASTNVSVLTFLNSASGYLGATSVQTKTYQVGV